MQTTETQILLREIVERLRGASSEILEIRQALAKVSNKAENHNVKIEYLEKAQEDIENAIQDLQKSEPKGIVQGDLLKWVITALLILAAIVMGAEQFIKVFK